MLIMLVIPSKCLKSRGFLVETEDIANNNIWISARVVLMLMIWTHIYSSVDETPPGVCSDKAALT